MSGPDPPALFFLRLLGARARVPWDSVFFSLCRIYAVDSTRLLRTLRCAGEVSLMRLFDPILAVLSSAAGRVSFRDLYADGGGGLGQVWVLSVRYKCGRRSEGVRRVGVWVRVPVLLRVWLRVRVGV